MEEGLKLPLPKEFEVYNGDSVIGKVTYKDRVFLHLWNSDCFDSDCYV